VLHGGMPYDPIQLQVHGGLKVAKMANFKGCLLCQYACNQKTNDEFWYSKLCPESGQIFERSFSVTWLSKLWCYEELTAAPYEAYLYVLLQLNENF